MSNLSRDAALALHFQNALADRAKTDELSVALMHKARDLAKKRYSDIGITGGHAKDIDVLPGEHIQWPHALAAALLMAAKPIANFSSVNLAGIKALRPYIVYARFVSCDVTEKELTWALEDLNP